MPRHRSRGTAVATYSSRVLPQPRMPTKASAKKLNERSEESDPFLERGQARWHYTRPESSSSDEDEGDQTDEDEQSIPWEETEQKDSGRDDEQRGSRGGEDQRAKTTQAKKVLEPKD